jgi:hypothetical protein
MQIHMAPPTAPEALFHSRCVCVAKVGSLRAAELKAKPHGEVRGREAKEGVREFFFNALLFLIPQGQTV